MIKALAIKELREIAWILAIGAAAYACMVGLIISLSMTQGLLAIPGLRRFLQSIATYGSDRSLPFVQGSFTTHYWVISFVLVVAIAFRQSLGENRRGTYCFLLHRPLSRTSVFITKLVVGLGLFLFVAALPLLALGTWAATPGTHPGPFEWSMTLPAWKIWASMSIAYLATFLCGIRQARWRGSRLAPFAAMTLPLLLLAAPLPMPWLTGSLSILLIGALLLNCILWAAATRDFA